MSEPSKLSAFFQEFSACARASCEPHHHEHTPLRPCLKSPTPSAMASPSYSPRIIGWSPPPTTETAEASSQTSSGSSTPHIRFSPSPPAIFPAPSYDRTPTPAHYPLSVQEVMELEAIQRSLPRASQLGDPLTGKRAEVYLKSVPVGLLPLLPTEDDDIGAKYVPRHVHTATEQNVSLPMPIPETPATPTSPPLTSPEVSPAFISWKSPGSVRFTAATAPVTSPNNSPTYHPPSLAHLLPAPKKEQRQRARFDIVPLLDEESGTSPKRSDGFARSPPASPATPVTATPSAPQLPSGERPVSGYFANQPNSAAPPLKTRLQALYSPLLVPVSPLVLGAPAPTSLTSPTGPSRLSRGEDNIGYFSVEEPLRRGSDGLPTSPPPPESPSPPSPVPPTLDSASASTSASSSGTSSPSGGHRRKIRKIKKSVMIINDMEMEIEESEWEWEPEPESEPEPEDVLQGDISRLKLGEEEHDFPSSVSVYSDSGYDTTSDYGVMSTSVSNLEEEVPEKEKTDAETEVVEVVPV